MDLPRATQNVVQGFAGTLSDKLQRRKPIALVGYFLAAIGKPAAYWKYLLATALFGLGNSSNAFLILRTQDIGASLEMTILIYAAFNLVAALISYRPTRFIHYLFEWF